MPDRSAVLRVALLVAAATSLGLDGGFRGCGDGGHTPGGSLPPGEPLECVADSDCDAPMCQDATCVAGRCVLGPARIDMDVDGFDGAPCGLDCDDRNPGVYPDAIEQCDGLDNDCDGRIDEDAPARLVTYEVDTEVLAASALPRESGVLLVSSERVGTNDELQVRWLDLGPRGAFARVTVEVGDARPLATLAVPTADGARIVWATGARELRESTVTVETSPAGASLRASAPSTLLAGLDIVAMAATELGASFAVLVDGVDPDDGAPRRLLVQPGETPVPLPYVDAQLDVAARGPRLYTPAGRDELAVLDPTGSELGRVRLPGRLAQDAVAAWSGRIFVVTEDAFDYTLREITPRDTVGAATPLVFGGDVQVDAAGAALAITRDPGFGELSLALYDERLALDERYDGLVPTRTGLPVHRRWVHETSEGLAVTVVPAPSSSSFVGVLGCGAPYP